MALGTEQRTVDLRTETGTQAFTSSVGADGVPQVSSAEPSRGSSLSIGVKIALVAAGLVLLAIALFAVVNYVQLQNTFAEIGAKQEARLLEDLEKKGLGTVRLQSGALLDPMLESRAKYFVEFVTNMLQDPDVASSAVFYETGAVAAAAPAGTAVKPLLPAQLDAKPKGERIANRYVFAAPIIFRREGGESSYKGEFQMTYKLDSLEKVRAELKLEEKAALEKLVTRSALVGLLLVVLGAALSVLQGARMAGPLRSLARQATRIAEGDFSAYADIRSRDEIGAVAVSFNHMVGEVRRLVNETARAAGLEKDIEVARVVQETFIGGTETKLFGGTKLAGVYVPAALCGGDFWATSQIGEHHVLVVVGDVTGHGVGPAMVTACAKGCTDAVRSLAVLPSPDMFLTVLNRSLYETVRQKFFMTCFVSLIDVRTGMMKFSNASHNPPLCMRVKEQRAVFIAEQPDAVLGEDPAATFQVRELQLEPGDMMVWYTDGLTEAKNDRDKQFGVRRLIQAVKEAPAELEVREVCAQIMASLKRFSGDVLADDDITIVTARYHPPARR
jgi:phosphoserine phosphatase RsbU/P